MVFSSTVFLFLFLPIAWILYFNPLCRKRRYRNNVLLLVSLAFYAWGEPVFVFVMLLSIVINWFLAIRIDKVSDSMAKKHYVLVAVLWNLGLLFVFKYLGFVLKNIGLLIGNDSISVNIALPIGISFFTFQILSYVLDVYYGNATVQKNVLDVALYVSMFPQLIAGPIVRYSVVADEINNRQESLDNFVAGFERFIIGLAKKVLLANYLAIMVDNIFLMDTRSVATAWLGAVGYALQIYFDFSGYSDMAIGLGLIFGFHFNENFNYPYISKSIPEFWRRWHISVSEWFRDYLFYPIMRSNWCQNLASFSKKKFSKNVAKLIPTVVATLIVWISTGVWHGANWTYIFWGLYYGILIALSSIVKKPMKKLNGKLHIKDDGWFDIVRLIRTLFLVCIGYVFFRSDSMTYAWEYLKSMFGVGAIGVSDDVFSDNFSSARWILLVSVIFSMPITQWIKNRVKLPLALWDMIKLICMMVLFVLSVLACIKSTYNPFIYFNF
jgi:D-alanyl-lipoteichoic acid acyltransferase DltB (MBOAT superfamily)